MKYGVVWCSVGFIFGLSSAYPLLSKRQACSKRKEIALKDPMYSTAGSYYIPTFLHSYIKKRVEPIKHIGRSYLPCTVLPCSHTAA